MNVDNGNINQTELNETEYQVMHVRHIRTNKTAARRKQPLSGAAIETSDDNLSSTTNVKPMKVCVLCGNEYKFQHSLESHMRRHRNEKPFVCKWVKI